MEFGLDSEEMGVIKQIIRDANIGRKIQVIKGIRVLTGLGLKEAKDWVDEIQFSAQTDIINLRTEIKVLQDKLFLMEKSRLDILFDLERSEQNNRNLCNNIDNLINQIKFIKGIILQDDIFTEDSLSKAIIAHLNNKEK